MDGEKKVKAGIEKEEVKESTGTVKGKYTAKKLMALSAATLVLIGAGIGAYFLLQKGDEGESQAAIMDVNGQLGNNGSREDEMKKMMDDSMVAVSINSMPYFETGASEGTLKIENMDFNKRLMSVEIHLDSNLENGIKDQPIYRTEKLLPPNSHISEDKLNTVLTKGVYPATAYITTYDVNDPGKYLGQASVGIEITVGK